jgi:hypothetical protein
MKTFNLKILKKDRPINSILIRAESPEDVKDFFKNTFSNCDASYEELPCNPVVVLTPERKAFFTKNSNEFKSASGRLYACHEEHYDLLR